MKAAAAALLAAFACAGCASDPKEAAAEARQRSKEEIQAMLEEVIAAIRENRPEVYFERLCLLQRNAYPLDEMREDWSANRALLEQMSASMTVKTIAVDESDPNVATAIVSAPNHPLKNLPFVVIRENGAWRIREGRLQ